MRRFQASIGLAALSAIGLWGGSAAYAVWQDAPPPQENAPPPGAAGEVTVPPEGDVELPEEYEALARGPLHEAFANPYVSNPQASEVVSEQPPEPIDEIPPEAMPTGENIVWIPGYWGWDPAETQFVWVSGLWREIPSDRRWIPGYWTEAEGGFQWISGFWSESSTEQIVYLPEPPPSQEQGPNIAPPSQDSVWIPGCWLWEQSDYQWRPGYWGPVTEGWVWIPDQYFWTPHGYVFVSGYWDRTFDHRGVMFAPVVYREPIYTQPDYYYTPRVVVNTAPLLLHLFASPGYSHYYYGDYYGYQPQGAAFFPWYSYSRRTQLYDPLLTYYQWSYARRDINLVHRLSSWNNYFVGHEQFRPPRTFRAQRQFVRAIDVDNAPVQVSSVVLTNTYRNAIRSETNNIYRFTQLNEDRRNQFRDASRQWRDFRQQRRDFERTVARAADNAPENRAAENAAERANRQPGERRAGLRLPDNPIARTNQDRPGQDPANQDRPDDARPNVPGDQQDARSNVPGDQQPGADEADNRPGERRGAGPPPRPEPIQRDSQDRPGANRPDRPNQPGQPDRPNQPGGDRPDQPGTPGADRPDRPDRPDQPGQPGQPERPDQPGADEEEAPRFPRFGVGPRDRGNQQGPEVPGQSRGEERPGQPGAPGADRPEQDPSDRGRAGGNDPFGGLPPGVERRDVPGIRGPRGDRPNRPGQGDERMTPPGRGPGAPGAGTPGNEPGAAPRPNADAPGARRPGGETPNVQPPNRGRPNAGPPSGAGRPNRPANEAGRPRGGGNRPAPNPGAAPRPGGGNPPAAGGGGRGNRDKGKPDKN